MNAAAAADGTVPSGVTVEAVNYLGPQLSGRDTVLLWDGDGGSPLYPPWVVADVRQQVFTFYTLREQKQRVALLLQHGYRIVFQRDGYLVLHQGAGRAASTGSSSTGSSSTGSSSTGSSSTGSSSTGSSSTGSSSTGAKGGSG